ncbi:unnamed protein product [Prunus armeniaca]|uniref:Uncharacterized protein n=1 Tax=Prunus armeniaca TaxID=36596 RepID=A0A6J5XKH8_PRUAR|nr:unnamed protein product [Prunus armeniaca]
MEAQSEIEVTKQNKMLPPQPGTFEDREDLIKYVRDFGASQGYVVTIKKSRKDRESYLVVIEEVFIAIGVKLMKASAKGKQVHAL